MSEPHPGGPGDPLGRQVQELLAQVARAVGALNRLAATLEEALARPPVHLQVERLDVQTLAFHLGDIDVEELQGELNIGITHSLRLQPPERGVAAQPEPPGGDRPVRQREQAQGEQKKGVAAPDGQRQEMRIQPTLRNSVVSRRLALMSPAPAPPSGPPPPEAPPASGAAPAPEPGGAPPHRVQVWPPPQSEGSRTDDKGTP